jgi:tripartite-type tricarboxylate transporter receptor subunit TctC
LQAHLKSDTFSERLWEGGMRFGATLIIAASVLGGSAADVKAQQSYPTRPITMIVPFTAGGPTDVLARILGQHMSQSLGQQIVVENVTGGGGTIGSTRVAKAAADGYTMVMGNLGTHAASIGIYKNLPYDPRVDFEPVMLVGSTPMVLITRKGFPAETLKDFIAYATANPSKVSFGSAGTGSISHLTYLLFVSLTKTEIQHVPYRGLSQAVNDLLAGQIDMMFDQVVTATPHIVSGGVKPIAVTAPARAPSIPNVPSSTEAGLPALHTIAWTALFFPKGTPKPIIERMNAAVAQAMRDEGIVKRMAELGSDLPAPDQRTPEALANLVRAEIDRWVPLVRGAGVAGQ